MTPVEPAGAGGVEHRDEGGDPACWAHLFDDDEDVEAGTPGEGGPGRRVGSGDELDDPPGAPLLSEPPHGVLEAPVVAHDVGQQVAEAAEAGAEMILLDNMDVVTTGEAVRLVGGRSRTESSGRLTLDSARDVAMTGVDYISVGALTHSAPVLDICLDLTDEQGAG